MHKHNAINRILLINPQMRFYPMNPRSIMPPLGLLYIASALKNDYNVKILDAAVEGFNNIRPYDNDTKLFGLEMDVLVKRVVKFRPHVVGISCLFSIGYPIVLDICKRLKKTMPEIKIVLGGSHPSYTAKDILLHEPSVDYIIIGEGERSFNDLLLCLNEKLNISNIDGIGYRDLNSININNKKKYIADLDVLPYPDWELISFDLYKNKCIVPQYFSSKNGHHASIITTRGCPHKCSFCVSSKYWGNKFRTRSPENVLHEIEYLISKFNVKRISILDDNFLADKQRAIELLKGIKKKQWDIHWYLPSGLGIWDLDEEILSLMKETGLSLLGLSLESCNQDILKNYIQKPINLDKSKKIFKIINKLKIKYYISFIMGFPDDTRKTLQDTFDYIKQIDNASVIFNIASPLPGTKLLQICQERNCLEDSFDFTRLNYTRSFIRTKDFTGVELTNYVQRKQTLINVSNILRSPIYSLRKNIHLAKDPLILREFARVHWHRFFGVRGAE